MVATDVASRGIGMLDRIFIVPFPFRFLFPSLLLKLGGFMWIALLSATDFSCLFSRLVRAPDVSFGPLVKNYRGILVQCSLLRLSFRLTVYQTGTEADWIFLDSFKLHFQGYPGSSQEAILKTRMP